MSPNDLIESLGGTCAVARFFNIKPPSVSGWKADGIPKDRLICMAPILEEKGVASRKELLPDDWHMIWPDLKETA